MFDIERIQEFKYRDFKRVDPSPGGWPIAQFKFIADERIKEIVAHCPRIAMTGGAKSEIRISLKYHINGGIRQPHLHLGDEIVLLDKAALQKYLQIASEEVANIKDIADVESYIRF
jgi:hypothetical protein